MKEINVVKNYWKEATKQIPLKRRLKVSIYATLLVEHGKSFEFKTEDASKELTHEEISTKCAILAEKIFEDCMLTIEQWKQDGSPE